MRVLVVDDERGLTRALERGLAAEGFAVDVAHDGETGLRLATDTEYDAIVLDIMLPRRNGYDVVTALRERGIWTPVLLLSAKDGEHDVADGLDVGADDYLTKPFQMAELLARLRAIIRRSAGQANPVLQIGDIAIDTRTNTVSRAGLPVDLTPLEFRCLAHLAHNRDRNVTQLELTEQLYAQDFERDSNSVEVLIGRLRKKLGKDAISTRRGYGYRIGGDEG